MPQSLPFSASNQRTAHPLRSCKAGSTASGRGTSISSSARSSRRKALSRGRGCRDRAGRLYRSSRATINRLQRPIQRLKFIRLMQTPPLARTVDSVRPCVAFLADRDHTEVSGPASRRPALKDMVQMRERFATDTAARRLPEVSHSLKVALAGRAHSGPRLNLTTTLPAILSETNG